MIVLDTSGLLAAIDSSQRRHESARRALESDDGPLLLSPFVLAELDYLLATRVSSEAELLLLDQVAQGAYQLEVFDADDAHEASRLITRHLDLGIGLADASIVVLAARAGTNRILTLDERHFRVIRPRRGRAFQLLPTD
ncbi:MAG TPA: PIN domain-containing protein [Actinomycetota bacterium]|nr:PIN domain-containing protein [Actinomycetota bacterium]